MREPVVIRVIAWLSLVIGRFEGLKRIRAERIKRLVFVCRGNVCRSPYAEAVAKSLGLSACSCGVEVRRSSPVEAAALRAASLRGKDLSSHMSSSIFDIELESSDCLVVMDPSQLSVARDVASHAGCQITLIGLWRHPPMPVITDPYGKPLQTFDRCFDEIEESISGLVRWLQQVRPLERDVPDSDEAVTSNHD